MRQITSLTWPLIILFQVITFLKVIWMLRVSTCFNTPAAVRSTVILLHCLLQGWYECIRVIWTQLQKKTERNPQHQKDQQMYQLMGTIMKKLLMLIKHVGSNRKKMGYKYIFEYYLPQQKVLQKILEKVFINKKFTQCKTSRTLQINVFEITDNKNIWKLFPKYELLFLDQADYSSDPSEILILQFTTLRAFLPPSSSLSNFILINRNPSSTQSSSCFSSVSQFFSYPIRPHTITSIG